MAEDLEVDREFDPRDFPTIKESFWLSGNWNEVRTKIHHLFQSIETLKQDTEIPESLVVKINDEKKQLETAMRRRIRSIDEVRRRYEGLMQRVEESRKAGENGPFPTSNEPNRPRTVLQAAPTEPLPPSDSLDNLNNAHRGRLNGREFESEASLDATPPGRVRSMLDGIATTMRGYGLDMYDENDALSPVAGMTLTIAVVVAICVASQYFG